MATLDQVRETLDEVQEQLLEARLKGMGLWQPPDEVRHQQHMSDDHG